MELRSASIGALRPPTRGDLPVGDGLQEAPKEGLGEGPTVTSLPAAARCRCCLHTDVLGLDAMDEDGLQGAAEQVGVCVLAGHHGVRRHIALL